MIFNHLRIILSDLLREKTQVHLSLRKNNLKPYSVQIRVLKMHNILTKYKS